jgi:23S rRNA pseudouridine1911/1915/1917 synthase
MQGQRVDRFLAAVQGEFSRARIQSLIDEAHVLVNGRGVKASTKVKVGDVIVLTIPELKATALEAEDVALDIVFEDQSLLVVNKPAGMVVHPGAAHRSGTLVNALLGHVRDLKGVGGVERPGLVHRLDKDTSGLLVVAKDDATLKALQLSFQDRRISKTYLALVLGHPEMAGTFETLYGRHPKKRQQFSSKVKTGKPALTEFKTLTYFERASLVEVQLHTGRTHQIRVHFADAGFPLLGDSTYGSRSSAALKVIPRQALHAARLEFVHPRTKRKLKCMAPLPQDFQQALERMEKEIESFT